MNEANDVSRKELVKRTLTLLGIVAGVLAAIYLVMVGMRFFTPLILAFIFSSIMEPMIRLLSKQRQDGTYKKAGLPRFIAVIIAMVIFFSILGVIMMFVINGFVGEVVKFATELPAKLPAMLEQVNEWAVWIEQNIKMLPVEVTGTITSSLSTLASYLIGIVGNFAKATVSWVSNLPMVILLIMFTIMTTYFLSVGKYRYKAYFYDSLPSKWVQSIDGLYRTMISALVGYLKAQFIIMCANFLVILLGLTILRVDYNILLSVILAVLDFLPSIGPGTVFIPWGLYNIIVGNYYLGFGVLLLYICTQGVRQLLEPRVLSQQIGLHPILTMASMYAGMQALGILGIFIGPVTVLIIKYMLEAYLNGRSLKEYLAG